MDDEYVEVGAPGDMEVYRRLDAFADARLAPDPVAMRRIRARLIDAAAAQAEALGFDRAGASTSGTGALVSLAAVTGQPTRRTMPRTAAALLAASLTLAVATGTVAAAQAGGPLYDARVWVETLGLPAGGIQRAEAQLVRLDARLAEVERALAEGDGPAAAAALEAYGEIVDELDRQLGSDSSTATEVRDNVAKHLAVLDMLVGRVPPQAQDALRHARDRSDNALDHLGGSGSGKGNGNGQSGNGQSGNGNSGQGTDPGTGPGSGQGEPGSGNPGQGSDPGTGPGSGEGEPGVAPTDKPPKSPKPTKPASTPKSTQTAKPDPTPEPEPTERPGRTPPQRPSHGRPTP